MGGHSVALCVPRLMPLYQLLQPMASCARVAQCAQAVPTLLQAFFSAVTQVSWPAGPCARASHRKGDPAQSRDHGAAMVQTQCLWLPVASLSGRQGDGCTPQPRPQDRGTSQSHSSVSEAPHMPVALWVLPGGTGELHMPLGGHRQHCERRAEPPQAPVPCNPVP